MPSWWCETAHTRKGLRHAVKAGQGMVAASDSDIVFGLCPNSRVTVKEDWRAFPWPSKEVMANIPEITGKGDPAGANTTDPEVS